MTKGTDAAQFELVVLPAQDPRAEASRAVEREVFLEAFGNTPELLHQEYDPHEPRSAFITVFERSTGNAAGMVRVLLGPPLELKTVQDLSSLWHVDPLDTFKRTSPALSEPLMVDVATLAVSRSYRASASSSAVSMALYHGISRFTRELGLRTLVTVYDVKVFRLLNRLFFNTWYTFDGVEPLEYLGSSASIPSWCDNDLLEKIMLEKAPALAQDFFGLEDSSKVAFPDWPSTVTNFKHLL